MTHSNRRQFLLLAGGVGGALSMGLYHQLFSAAESNERNISQVFDVPSSLHTVKRTSWALGSEVSIVALHQDLNIAKEAIDSAFSELEVVEEVMSIYRPTSQLSRLNQDGELADPHPYFIEVLRTAESMSRRSSGAFDITVQPLWSLYAEAKASGGLPTNRQIEQARRKVDWRRVVISDSRVMLLGEGTQITLNGIAQGFAADKATAALQKRGVRHALINTGEIAAIGRKREGQAWTVGIQHPRNENAYVSLANLVGRTVATSGDYATRFTEDFRLNHLLDPHSGRSPDQLASVSVVATTGLMADALSTAVFVLGPERGAELVQSLPGADAFFVCKDGKTLMTDGFPLES